MRTSLPFVFLLVLALGCSKGESQLSKALSTAVKEKKVSMKKMESILQEYEKLHDEDKIIAREYLNQILNAIEMGGDSTHIDVVRRQILRTKK
jgi:predicted solute-binding protein